MNQILNSKKIEQHFHAAPQKFKLFLCAISICSLEPIVNNQFKELKASFDIVI